MKMEEAFLADIVDRPEDDGPRLVYADWLEENGQPERAEFIRTQCRLANLPEDSADRLALEEREQALLAEHGAAWAATLPPWARKSAPTFRRGLVAEVAVSTGDFVRHGAALWRVAPVQGASLRNAAQRLADLGDCPHLARLSHLDLSNNNLRPEGLRALAASPHLANVTSLKLRETKLGAEGIRALGASPYLTNLTTLDVYDGSSNQSIGPRGRGGAGGVARFRPARIAHPDLGRHRGRRRPGTGGLSPPRSARRAGADAQPPRRGRDGGPGSVSALAAPGHARTALQRS
jgi:uncharacterized protein (TIGR02996 family)